MENSEFPGEVLSIDLNITVIDDGAPAVVPTIEGRNNKKDTTTSAPPSAGSSSTSTVLLAVLLPLLAAVMALQ